MVDLDKIGEHEFEYCETLTLLNLTKAAQVETIIKPLHLLERLKVLKIESSTNEKPIPQTEINL